ncbi:MAG: hypothetical protein DHS20C09_10280 [marine bacterium B5-7]|jgi:hypothetical protein|nr:MAG: hypothetical protein DHS20C09_10280 [marine bacterium B5-7]
MKKTLIATAIVLATTNVSADFSSTWILQRTIITDEHKVFDTALDENILIGGVMKVVNDQYELKGLMCDERTNECVKIVESLTITALDHEGLWADVTDENATETTVHIFNRTPRSTESLNLFFTDADWGSTVTHSFRLIGHHEELLEFEFDSGVGILEGKMLLDQMHSNQ